VSKGDFDSKSQKGKVSAFRLFVETIPATHDFAGSNGRMKGQRSFLEGAQNCSSCYSVCMEGNMPSRRLQKSSPPQTALISSRDDGRNGIPTASTSRGISESRRSAT